MQKLVRGIRRFRTGISHSQRDLFRALANGQKPAALFITCSDSRIDPNLLTQTDPGDLFVLRNAGNIIPPPTASSGEIATIELAVMTLGIRDIVVCGHSDCGAMKGLLDPSLVPDTAAVAAWLDHAQRAAQIIATEYKHLSGTARLMATVEENVLVQIENLRAYPFIAERLERGELTLHGWVYKFDTAEVFHYNPDASAFVPLLGDETPLPVYPRSVANVAREAAVRAMRVGEEPR